MTRPRGDWDAARQQVDPSSGSNQPGAEARLTAWVRGRVQGVGFRWWVRRNALELGLLGTAENLVDGRVKVIAEGGKQSLIDCSVGLRALAPLAKSPRLRTAGIRSGASSLASIER